jgi:hypothetical protein
MFKAAAAFSAVLFVSSVATAGGPTCEDFQRVSINTALAEAVATDAQDDPSTYYVTIYMENAWNICAQRGRAPTIYTYVTYHPADGHGTPAYNAFRFGIVDCEFPGQLNNFTNWFATLPGTRFMAIELGKYIDCPGGYVGNVNVELDPLRVVER